jgi:thiamine-monophosphate kinase
LKESEVIHSLFQGKNAPEDDCHFIPPDTLVTTDSLVEGTHFLHAWSSPKDLAEKLIEVNVSDIVASGGIPEICFLNLGLSDLSKEKRWILAFSSALRKRLKQLSMTLAGGDTFYSKTTHLTMTVLGKSKSPWLRTGGKDGDFLYLTGQIGDSELGLQSLKEGWKHRKFHAAKRIHLSPTSQIKLVPRLTSIGIHACMDLTDGLIQDSERLATASEGRLEINMNDLPISKLAYNTLGWEGVMGSGEELQLLILTDQTLPKKSGVVRITKIGRFQKWNKKQFDSNLQKPVTFLLNGVEFIPKKIGYTHFS